MALSDLLTVEETAERFRVSERTVWNYIKSGELASLKLGKKRVIPETVIDAFIAARLTKGRPS